MGAESARRYNRNQAKRVVDGIGRIINRINPKYTPYWMRSELDIIYHKAQCIQREYEMVMRGFGDKI